MRRRDKRPAEEILEEKRKCSLIYTRRCHENQKIARMRQLIAEYDALQEAKQGRDMSAIEEYELRESLKQSLRQG